MDDLSRQLGEILSDEESMAKVKALAESLMSGESGGVKQNEPALMSDELKTLVSLVSKFKASGDDDRTRLLYALKPHLGEKKQQKVDTAIKILKLLEILPLVKESGILGTL